MTFRGLLLRVAAAGAALLAVSSPATAQVTTGAIGGVIVSDQNAPVPEAQIQVVNRATGFTVGVRTNEAGRYVVPGLEVGGTYAVIVRRIGFEQQTRENVRVTLGQTTPASFTLATRAAVLSEVRTVAGQEAIINPSRTGVATTVSDTALRRLPTLNRNFTDFVALTPQVSQTGPGLSAGGTNNRYNNIQIDGATEADLFGLGSTGQPGGQASGKSIAIESVKEYQVLLAPTDVRQGNFAGLLVNAVTKSGTNDFAGSVYGVTRNQGFTRTRPYINRFEQSQYGFSLGGPIVRNRAFFFVNPEIQRRTVPASGGFLGGDTLISPRQPRADSVRAALEAYGVPTGSLGLVNNDNPLTNVFGRVDVVLPRNAQLVLRHNYGRAEDDIFSRTPTSFKFASNAYRFRSTKNATVGQLRSLFGNGAFNELLLNVTTIRDRRAPAVSGTPEITVLTPGYTFVSGAERFSQGNELDQDIAEVTDNFTLPLGVHRLTVGTQNQFYKVRNLFTQSSYGVWTFGTLDSLRQGLARQYIVGVPLARGGAVRFKAAAYGVYAQDEWSASDRLNVTFGLRADVPVFFDKPPFNKSVADSLGRNTGDIPSGNVEWSPRVGFNWNVTGDDANQLRGNLGLYSGRPAFVWLSNAFQNSGSIGVGVLTCASAQGVPAFNGTNISQPPTACNNGATAQAGGEIDLLDPDLKFPQNLRMSVGFDRRLYENWIATVEGMYTRGVNGLFYRNIALAGPQGTDRYGRVIYGLTPGNPVRRRQDRSQVFDVTNQSNDHSYSISTGLQRRFARSYEGSIFYTHTRAFDVQSFTSSTAFSQYRFGRAWGGDQSDQSATRSVFEQRHRIVAQGTYSFPTRTDLTAIYYGESGAPFDFVVNGDPNGDGVTLNDPIYVPRSVTDTNEIRFAATRSYGGVTYTAAQQGAAFEQLIQDTECLRENRGRLIPRNACNSPWLHRVNLSARQSLSMFGAQNFTLRVDVFNFLNLLNENWGQQKLLPGIGFGPQAVLDLVSRSPTTGTLLTSVPVYGYNPTYQKFNSRNLSSNYQIQMQLQYSF